MHTLRLTFTCPDDKAICLQAESTVGPEASGDFSLPFADETSLAIVCALEPGFDPETPGNDQVIAVLNAAGLPTGEPLLTAVGDRLAAALFDSPGIAAALDVALGAAQGQNEALHLNLRFDEGCDQMAALPWELLRCDGRFLVADNTLTLTRTPLGAAPYGEALVSLPLHILLVLSEPLGASPIAPRHQARQLTHGLRALAAEGAVVVDELRPPTYDTLVEAVCTGGYHVLHFYGHGIYRDGTGHLLFEDAYGGPNLVAADDVGAVLHHSEVRLVVMGACQSATSGADRWSSAAAALLQAGVPLVVGMQVSMPVEAAQAFTRQFYLSLAGGKDVAQALGDARLPLRLAEHGKTWFIPALYSRALGEPRLFDRAAPRAVEAEAVARLRQVQAEVERLEAALSRPGVAVQPAEVADLRRAQEALRQAQAEVQPAEVGGYAPVFSLLYDVPPQPLHFVGRADELRAVARGLEGDAPTVIWGLGGIGKTALAVEVVHRQSWRFPGGVLWLDCRSAPPFDSLLNQMGAFCGHPEVETLEPAQRRATVRAHLSGLERCLLVWDNVETVWGQRAVREFVATLPRHCGSLLTTREDPQQASWPTIELSALSRRAMATLFSALGAAAGVKVVADDLPLLPQVLDWLQGHPLALTLAVPLAKVRGLKRLWDDLQRQPLKGVEAALRASYERLSDLPRRAFAQLSVFSVPFEYAAVEALLPGEGEVGEAVDVLVQRALLSFDGRWYTYHALVRQFAYAELRTVNGEWRATHRRAAEYLAARLEAEGGTAAEVLEEVDQWARAEEWATFARRASALVGSLDRQGYWPEIEARLRAALAAMRDHLEDATLEAPLLSAVAVMAYKQGEWARVIETYQRSLEIDERLGDEHGMATTFNNLGLVYADKGEWARAIELYQHSLEIDERLDDDHGMASTFNNLGSVYYRQGEWERAIELYQRSLETFERLGDNHGMAQTFHNLGNVYARKGEWERAIELYQRSLETYEYLGDVHGMAQARGNLGIMYRRKGKWERAIELYRRSLETYERLGDVHGVAQTFNNLGNVCADKGEWERAIELYQRSLETYERLGDVHSVAQTWGNLGDVYARKGEWERAIEIFQHSLETYECLSDVHGMAQAWGNLGDVYARKGEWERAIELFQHSLETYERLGDVHGMAQTWGKLGDVYARKGEWERAIEIFQHSLETYERLGDVYRVAQTWSNLGDVYARKGEWERAIEIFQHSLETYEHLGDVHGVAQTWGNLGSVYLQKGEWARAIETYQRSLETKERLGDVHGMAITWGNLGLVYAEKGEWERATEMYQRSLETFECLGDVHGMARAFSNLGSVYLQKDEWERAIEVYQRGLETYERLGDIHSVAQTFNNLGLVYAGRGEWEHAIELYQRSLKTYEHLDDVHGMAQTFNNLGLVHARQGEWARAVEMYQRSLETFERLGDIHGMASSWTNLAMVYLQTQRPEEAKPLLAQAYSVFVRLGSPHANTTAQGLVQACGSVDVANAYLASLTANQK